MKECDILGVKHNFRGQDPNPQDLFPCLLPLCYLSCSLFPSLPPSLTCASVTKQYNLVPANGWWYDLRLGR